MVTSSNPHKDRQIDTCFQDGKFDDVYLIISRCPTVLLTGFATIPCPFPHSYQTPPKKAWSSRGQMHIFRTIKWGC